MTRATLCACVPAALGAFDFGLLAAAGPRMAPALGVAGDTYPWLFSASAFAYGAAVVPAGALTRRLGPCRALAVGLGTAAAGVAMLALSHGLTATLAARVVFGLGGALAAIAALGLLAAAGRFAALGGAVAIGFTAGTLAAGVDAWRAVLALTSVAVLVAAADALRASGANGRSVPDPLPRARLLTAGIVLTAGAVAVAHRWVALPLALAAAAALVAAAPRRPRLAAACVAGAATTGTGVGATVLLGPALSAEALPPALLGVFGLGVVPGAWLARRLVAVAGPGRAAAGGVSLQALALAVVAVVLALGAPAFALAAALAGFGMGHVAANAGAAAAALADGPPALLIAAQYVGGGVGPLAIGAVATAHGTAGAVLVAAGIAFAGALPSLIAGR